ncbi:MAG: hypothetical protein H0X62_03490 [Bacteroidetes bacterium]|nr:hypothetical protein [Bacteroidota bacterium]
MKNALIISFFIVNCFQLFAQRLEAVQEEEAIEYKSEVWLGITPVAQALLGAFGQTPDLAITYKRKINNQLWLRLGSNLTPVERQQASRSIFYILVNDSIVKERFELIRGSTATGRAGLEFRSKNGRLQRYLGLDLLYSYSAPTREIREFTYTYDSLRPLPQRGFYGSWQNGQSQLLYRENIITHKTGLGLAAGLYFPFNERFALAAQTYIDVGIKWRNTKSRNFGNQLQKESGTIASLAYNYRAINEISLVFKFK